MNSDDRKITILFGSQTGNLYSLIIGCAQEVAERIERDSKRRYFKVNIMNMNDYSLVK